MQVRSAGARGLLAAVCFGTLGVPVFGPLGCSRQTGATEHGDIHITADGDGFAPSAVVVAQGAPANLVFTRTTDETCATAVVFPELDIKKDLPKGTPVTIAIPTGAARTFTFQCGMGMYKSSVVVRP